MKAEIDQLATLQIIYPEELSNIQTCRHMLEEASEQIGNFGLQLEIIKI